MTDNKLLEQIEAAKKSQPGDKKLSLQVEETRLKAELARKQELVSRLARWEQAYGLKVVADAELLQRQAFQTKEGDTYLTADQAMVVARTAHKWGLDPFGDEVWFNPVNGRVNKTLQGKLSYLRNLGFAVGGPKWKRIPEDEDKPVKGYTCTIKYKAPGMDQLETVEYTAYPKEWQMASNPNWRNRTDHMLRVRSQEKAVASIGAGASELPGDRDIETTSEPTSFEVTEPKLLHARQEEK